MSDPQIELSRDAVVSLREITKETLRRVLSLKVAPEQERFVASNAVSIAQAYFEGETAWFRAVYANETPVGFVMLLDDSRNAEYFLWRFMIDARYQKFGFGKRAILCLLEYVKSRPNATSLLTSYVPGEGTPGGFYEGLGFVPTGDLDDGEVVLKLEL